MNATKDQYDEAIEYLTAHPEDIYHAWNLPSVNPGGCLFLSAAPLDENGDTYELNPSDGVCGCLTQIRSGAEAWTWTLTKAIRADERIPKNTDAITVADLPVFAEWQRRIDREVRAEKHYQPIR